MTTQKIVQKICSDAKAASVSLAALNAREKNKILASIKDTLWNSREEILSANQKDISLAKQKGTPTPMLDRLLLNEQRIQSICCSLDTLISLPDPVGSGKVFTTETGLEICCERVPLGVVAIIYEARPNVTVDAAALCLKTGNAVVLRGGREALNTNIELIRLMKFAIEACGTSPDVLGFVESGEGHESANALMSMRGLVDVLIPRGSARLIRSVVQNSSVPVIETGAGNCHLYVDESADINMAVNVAINAKCSRPAVCNAIETMLVHSSVAEKFLVEFEKAVADKYTLEIRGCDRTLKILPSASIATEADFDTEYDDLILAVKIVDSVDEAINHINKYNTGHSEAIITNSQTNANKFRQKIDAAAVYVNASTRFTDGGEFGFGAEIGISTQKLHARGPMGLEALTTQKYLINGNGQVR